MRARTERAPLRHNTVHRARRVRARYVVLEESRGGAGRGTGAAGARCGRDDRSRAHSKGAAATRDRATAPALGRREHTVGVAHRQTAAARLLACGGTRVASAHGVGKNAANARADRYRATAGRARSPQSPHADTARTWTPSAATHTATLQLRLHARLAAMCWSADHILLPRLHAFVTRDGTSAPRRVADYAVDRARLLVAPLLNVHFVQRSLAHHDVIIIQGGLRARKPSVFGRCKHFDQTLALAAAAAMRARRAVGRWR